MLQGAGGNYQMVKFAKNLRDKNEKSIGTYHDNPLHNMELYEVKFHNGELTYIEANIVAENMFSHFE